MRAILADGRFTLQLASIASRDLDTPVTSKASPLVYWRTKRPDELIRKDAAAIRLALVGTHLDSDGRWDRAIVGNQEGDEAVALDILVSMTKRFPIDAPEIDLAVSVILANALLGKTASSILLSWILRHRAKIDPPCALYSDLWLVADF